MTPLMFGPPQRRLFGLHHAGEGAAAGQRAVLLCNPFGHEAIRVQRLYRVLAERLSRAGHDVLRFDLFGTGDSGGDEEQGDLDGWAADIAAAHAQLRRLQPGAAVTWMGARLAAALAVRAAASGLRDAPQRLVLWDPIVEGAPYLATLRVKHVEALELSYCIPDPAWRRSVAGDASAFSNEAIGFAMPPALRAQLAALAPDTLRLPAQTRTTVLAPEADTLVRTWVSDASRGGAAARFVALEHPLIWTSDPQPNSAMVPAEALARLMSEIDASHE